MTDIQDPESGDAEEGTPAGSTSRWTKEGLNPKQDQNLIVYKATGMIYCRKRFSRLGIPDLPLTSTGFTIDQKLKARVKRDELFEAHKRFHTGESPVNPRAKVRLIGDIVDEIMRDRPSELGLRSGTVALYNVYFGKIKAYWGRKSLGTINQASFNAWIEHDRGLTPCRTPSCPDRLDCKVPEHHGSPRRSFADYAKYMNILCGYAHQKKYTHFQLAFQNPDTVQKSKILEKMRQGDNRGVDLLTPEEREVLELEKARLLTRDEINRLWAVFNEDMRDQFACAFGCMMRKRETLQAPWSEIDLTTGTWVLPAWRVKTGSKTGKGRSFRIAPWALERLRARHTRQAGLSRFVFPGWTKRKGDKVDKPVGDNKRAWVAAKDRAGIKGDLRWHDIRHTALTFALLGDPSKTDAENRLSIRESKQVSEFAGVSETTIRRVYLRTQVEHTQSVSTANAMDLNLESPVSAVFAQSKSNDTQDKGMSSE